MSDFIPLYWVGGRAPQHLKPSNSGLFSLGQTSPPFDIAFKNLSDQLAKRPKPAPEIWGDGPLRRRIGPFLSRILKENYDWPNDHFIPEDPFSIALLMPWDDLDVIEVSLQLEDALNIEMSNEDIETFFDGTLGDLMDYLIGKLIMKTAKPFSMATW